MKKAFKYGFPRVLRGGGFNPLNIDGLQLYLNKNTNVNSKLALSLNGSTDAVNIDSVLTPLASTTTGFWEVVYTPTNLAGVVQYILTFSDTLGTDVLFIYQESTGRIKVRSLKANVPQWRLETDNSVLTNNVPVKIGVKKTATNVVVYIDDVEVPQSYTDTTDLTFWFDSSTVDNGRISALNYNSLGDVGFLAGTIQNVKIWSDDTQTTLVASYLFNDANSPYKDYANSYDGSSIGTPTSVIGTQTETTEPLDEVFSWIDQSPNSFVFSQNTLTRQPQLASDGNSIDFDGTDDSLENGTANVFSGDSSGIVFFSGYNTGNTQRILSSSDNAGANDWIGFSVVSNKIGVSSVIGGVANFVQADTILGVGSFFYASIQSNGSSWSFTVNGVADTFTVGAGSNTGDWFGSVANRDSLELGFVKRSTPLYGDAEINKLIYSNDHTIDTSPILTFLSNPDN